MKINNRVKIRLILMGAVILLAVFLMPNIVVAHPGNTAADGCHYCRTNCDKWGVPWNERHCHGSVKSTPSPSTPRIVSTPVATPVPTPVCSIEKVTEEIYFEIEKIDDSNLAKGQSEIMTNGEKGVKEKSFEVCKLDGKETSRKLITEAIVKAPIKQVLKIGTKEPEGKVAGEKSSKAGVWTILIILAAIIALIIWAFIKRKK